MSNILVVGNVINDIYLRLDEQKNNFEQDEAGRYWLDVCFDEQTYPYFRRTSVYSGAAVSMEVLAKFGHDVEISGVEARVDENGFSLSGTPKNFRYIISRGSEAAYLTSEERGESKFFSPLRRIDWIFVDRSAEISSKVAQEIVAFLAIASHVKLAVYATSEMTLPLKLLADRADLVFVDNDEYTPSMEQNACYISDSMIKLNIKGEKPQKIKYSAKRAGEMTHLTAYSIIAGAVVGGVASERGDILEMAKKIVETASLDGVKKLDQLTEKKGEKVNLSEIAQAMVAYPKGILAADESGGSTAKKFAAAGIVDDERHRRDYRNILFTVPELEKYVNGVILFDETTRQLADNGQNFVQYLTGLGIIPGIKVDQGLEEVSEEEINQGAYAGEKWTRGLEDLAQRAHDYFTRGLRFAKWRAAFEIVPPSEFAITKNCEILANYARICQENGLVPIVEPEVVYDNDYTIESCAEVTGEILDCLFEKLCEKEVDLSGVVLKCNMVLAGKKSERQSIPEEVGEATARVLKEHVPEEVAGVVFLSGGQSVEQATENLHAVIENGPFPWPVTFSFARALQDPALEAWKGNNENVEAAREAMLSRLKANQEALMEE